MKIPKMGKIKKLSTASVKGARGKGGALLATPVVKNTMTAKRLG